jgi:hypothetical protein
MLHLTKWYLDLVTPGGTTLIVYAAALRWRALRIEFASTFVAPPLGDVIEASSWSGVELPHDEDDRLRFSNGGLAIDGEWERTAPAVAATLLDDEEGRVRWDCLYPGAQARVRSRNGVLTGLGYAERLTFTRPPWSLPLHTLRWGRFVSARHTLAWIRWDGGPPRRWAWLDGAPQPGSMAEGDGVTGLDRGVALDLTPSRVLCDRRALQVLSHQLPALNALPLGRLKSLREIKRLDRGHLKGPSLGDDEGWVIHETVTW